MPPHPLPGSLPNNPNSNTTKEPRYPIYRPPRSSRSAHVRKSSVHIIPSRPIRSPVQSVFSGERTPLLSSSPATSSSPLATNSPFSTTTTKTTGGSNGPHPQRTQETSDDGAVYSRVEPSDRRSTLGADRIPSQASSSSSSPLKATQESQLQIHSGSIETEQGRSSNAKRKKKPFYRARPLWYVPSYYFLNSRAG